MKAKQQIKKISTYDRMKIYSAISYLSCPKCQSKNFDVDIYNVIFCFDCGNNVIEVDLFKTYYM